MRKLVHRVLPVVGTAALVAALVLGAGYLKALSGTDDGADPGRRTGAVRRRPGRGATSTAAPTSPTTSTACLTAGFATDASTGRRPVRRPAAPARRQQRRAGAAQRRRRRTAVRPVRPRQPVAVPAAHGLARPSRSPSCPPAGRAGPAPAPRRSSTASSSPPGWSCPPTSRRSSSGSGSTASPARGSRPPRRAGTPTCSPGWRAPSRQARRYAEQFRVLDADGGDVAAGRAADPAQRAGGLQRRRFRADRLTPGGQYSRTRGSMRL